jgi:hypothetical protein
LLELRPSSKSPQSQICRQSPPSGGSKSDPAAAIAFRNAISCLTARLILSEGRLLCFDGEKGDFSAVKTFTGDSTDT